VNAVREWVAVRARALAASLATVPHARAIVAVCTAVVLLAGIAGLALHDDGGDIDVATNREQPTDLTPDTTDTTLFDEALPTSMLPPVSTIPGPALPGATTSSTSAPGSTTTTAVPAGGTCSGTASVVEGTGLWVVDRADGRVRRVVSEETDVYVWSPDGNHLAFLGGPQAGRRLNVLDIATGTTRTVYFELPVRAEPAWTADSKSIVFVARPAVDRDRIYRVPVGGGAPTKVHDLDSLAGDVGVTPEGEVVFTDGGTLAVVDADGENKRTLVQSSQARSVQTFALSPDGNRVAYSDRQHLAVMAVSDAKAVNVASTEPPGRVLTWAADGSRVAFVRADGGREVAVAAAADGTGSREVGSRGSDFALAPSGKELGWVADKGTTPRATATALATGADRQLGSKMWQPTFAPTGDDIAVYATVPNQARPALCVLRAGALGKLAQLGPTTAPYSALAWSPSGATLAFAALG
jgi:dipeptidyl aminopeptidase/acylaminoacyl peptidase